MANSSDTVSMLGRVRSLSHHCHVSCEQVAARVEATLSFTAMTLCCDIVAAVRSLSLGAMTGGNAPFAVLGFFPTKTAENSERTADAAAVLVFAKPSAAQDFRGEGDVDG